jgi:hypothetical protein
MRIERDIGSLLQFLIFGQFVGKKDEDNDDDGGNRYEQQIQRLKTMNMIERRKKEKATKDKTAIYRENHETLNQFN